MDFVDPQKSNMLIEEREFIAFIRNVVHEFMHL